MRLFLFILFATPLLFGQSQERIDSLERQLEQPISTSEKISTYRHLIIEYIEFDMDKTAAILQEMEAFANPDSRTDLGMVSMCNGIYHQRISKLKEAKQYYKKAIAFFDSEEDIKLRILNIGNLAITHRRSGEFDEALPLALESIRLKDSIGTEPQVIARDYITVGSIYGDLKQYEDSNKAFFEALQIYEDANNVVFTAHLKTNIAINYDALGDVDKSEEFLLNSIAVMKANNLPYYLTINKNALASLYVNHELFDKALPYLKDVIDESKALNMTEVEALAHQKYGKIQFDRKAIDTAIYHWEQSLALNQKSNAKKSIATDHGRLANAYASKGIYDKAYEHEIKHHEIQDSLAGEATMNRINELKIAYDTEKKETEIQLLNKEVRLKKLGNTIYGIALVSLILLGVALFYSLRQRQRKKALVRQKREDILRQQIAFKKKELTSQTMHLVQKNSFLQTLTEGIEQLENDPDSIRQKTKRLRLLLKSEKASERDWESFKSYFTEVHEDFYKKLKSASESISEKEIRLASFLRMNLSTKEIASMLNVLPETIIKAKYRLKKKLNLNKEQDLLEYLNAL
ncbi:MAG: hypothetical protein CMC35_02595 [Flavobacteriaceae bacterium]|nr:hypothetical protein [Flavobacteriaceae bacterium]